MERVYVIPLRKAYRASRPRRAEKAIRIVREFVERHMKAEQVVIGEKLNQEIWKRGMERPPRRVKVVAVKDGNVARVELFGHEIPSAKARDAEKAGEKGKGDVKAQEAPKEAREGEAEVKAQEASEESKEGRDGEAGKTEEKEAAGAEGKAEGTDGQDSGKKEASGEPGDEVREQEGETGKEEGESGEEEEKAEAGKEQAGNAGNEGAEDMKEEDKEKA